LGATVSVTAVVDAKTAVQVAPQSIPKGKDVSLPEPDTEVDRVKLVPFNGMKVAVTDRACVIETVQLLEPVHAPVQPANDWFAPGIAVSVTAVLAGNVPLQLEPEQMTPEG